MTRQALSADIALVRARGAKPIVLVPQFLPEEARERAIRHDVLDMAGIDYLLVPIQSGWRRPGDGHPTPRGSRAIAEALAAELDGTRAGEPGKPVARPAMAR